MVSYVEKTTFGSFFNVAEIKFSYKRYDQTHSTLAWNV